MEVQKRWGTKIIPNHALDKIGNPSLTSYALEYSGALRMIRVFVFSKDLSMPLRGVAGDGIYRLERPT